MKVITAMTECPKGSNHKLDYDPQTNRFKLSKILPAGLSFPFDFGSIPGTKGEDGDPLDIIIISETTSFPGCLIDCRIVGGIQALQTERDGKTIRNDRFIGIPEVSEMYADIDELAQLSENILNHLEAFFKNYNKQAGKQFEVLARLDAAAAYRLINN